MIPGLDPRQLKQMMRQMGMSQEDINATKVIIECSDKSFVFENPSVQKILMQGQTNFQISGDFVEKQTEVKINILEDDIKTVSEQANVDFDEAKKALEENNADIAEAIIFLENKNN